MLPSTSQIRNPETGRLVNIGSRKYDDLVRRGVIISNQIVSSQLFPSSPIFQVSNVPTSEEPIHSVMSTTQVSSPKVIQNTIVQNIGESYIAPEVLQQILLKLDLKDIREYCHTYKSVMQICKSEEFWLMKLDNDFAISNMLPSEYFKIPGVIHPERKYEIFKDDIVDHIKELADNIKKNNINAVAWLLKYYQISGYDMSNLLIYTNNFIPYNFLNKNYADTNMLNLLAKYGIYPDADETIVHDMIQNGQIDRLQFMHQHGKIPHNILSYQYLGTLPWHVSIPYLKSLGY